jgi:Type II intron maturase
LTANQCRFDKKLLVLKTSKSIAKKAGICRMLTNKQHLCKPVLNADLKNVFHQLKKSEFIHKNSVKVNTKKSLILYEDYKIIRLFSNVAVSILNYFSCCDNFSKIKSIVYCFIRLSLAATLMQKHRMSSTYQVFKEYGENLRVKHP